MAKKCRPSPPKEGTTKKFAKSFRHWRTGKVYFAEDYGHKAWPIG